MANINKITVDGIEYNITIPSGLTEAEQAQIRQNIGAVGQEESNVVQDGTYPAMTVGNATNAQNDGNGSNIATTYAKISDFDRLILENEYPVGGKPYIQFDGMQTPAQRWAGTSWEIDTDYTGRVLVGSGTGFTLGATGGSADSVIIKHVHHTYKDTEGDVKDLNLPIALYSPSAYSDLPYSLRNAAKASNWGGATDEVGEDGTGKNMQPYKVVAVWKRIA